MKAIKSVITKPPQPQCQAKNESKNTRRADVKSSPPGQHTDYEQARHQRGQSGRGMETGQNYSSLYSDTARNNAHSEYNYSVPTSNYYNPLN